MQNKYRKRRRQRNIRALILIILLIIFVWLFAAIISGTSPITFAKNIFSRASSENITIEKMRKKELRKYAKLLISQMDSLQVVLDDCQSQIMNRTATVNVDAESLNIRKDPSIDSEIVSKIPNGEKVDVIQIDQKTYFLDSKAGRWVQVSYDGAIGWVWGNYLIL